MRVLRTGLKLATLRPKIIVPGGGDSLWRGNEPAGMTFIAERPFVSDTENGWTTGGGSGEFEYRTDGDGPHSPPSVMHAWLPAGYAAGNGPVGFDFVFPISYKTVYVCYWHKYSSNYVNEVTGSKQFYLHTTPDLARPFFIAANQGSTGFAPYVFDQGGVSWSPNTGNGNHAPNLVPSAAMTAGQWYLVEAIFVGNSAGIEDGSLDWYLNGVHVGSYSYQWNAAGALWTLIHGTTIWGGTGDTVPALQDMYWDHIYVSGKN